MRAAVMLVVLVGCGRDEPRPTRVEVDVVEPNQFTYWCRADGGTCYAAFGDTRTDEEYAASRCAEDIVEDRRTDRQFTGLPAQGDTWCVGTNMAWCFEESRQFCFLAPSQCERFAVGRGDCAAFYKRRRL